MHKYFGILLVSLLLAALIPVGSYASYPLQIDRTVAEQLNQTATVPVIIFLRTQVDTRFARSIPFKQAKGAAVVAALRSQADSDQQAILAYFAKRGIATEHFYAVNAISATIDQPALEWLQQQPNIAAVQSDLAKPMLQEPIIQKQPQPEAIAAITPGVNEIKAPQVWALGYTGQDIVVASEDTGVHWTHEAIKQQYRGWNETTQTVDHDYNWHDGVQSNATSPCGTLWTAAPCDDNSHGTHTVGTMLGDNGANEQIGVAPDAQWIGCRNMDAGDGTIARYLSCIDWMLAPYPTDGTPAEGNTAKAPHIINNSWSCPASEGCSGATIDDMQPAIQNLLNAGIMFVGSAGNDGNSCNTITTPPALYPENFIVGAYDPNSGSIAGFSSRGPVTYQNETRIGPNVAAPGVSTRSALNSSNSAYGSKSGTSMAAPHVAGATALLWSARPELQGSVWLTRKLLEESARPTTTTQTCGGLDTSSVPNNTFGHGKLDVLAAIQPTFDGTITVNNNIVAGVQLLLVSEATSETLLLDVDNNSGTWQTSLPSGNYTVSALWNGETYPLEVLPLPARQLTTRNYNIEIGEPILATFEGTLTVTSEVVSGVQVLLVSHATSQTVLLDVEPISGTWQTIVPAGTYTVSALWNGETYPLEVLPLPADQVTTRDYNIVVQEQREFIFLPLVRR